MQARVRSPWKGHEAFPSRVSLTPRSAGTYSRGDNRHERVADGRHLAWRCKLGVRGQDDDGRAAPDVIGWAVGRGSRSLAAPTRAGCNQRSSGRRAPGCWQRRAPRRCVSAPSGRTAPAGARADDVVASGSDRDSALIRHPTTDIPKALRRPPRAPPGGKDHGRRVGLDSPQMGTKGD